MSFQSKSIFHSINKKLSEHAEIASELSKRLQLTYVEEKNSEGNVCFLESDEVRPEFREVFTPTDVAYYIYSLAQRTLVDDIANEKFYHHFPYPQNTDEFWSLVKKGKRMFDEA